MKIMNVESAIHDQIAGAGLHPNVSTLYTYDDTIYNPKGVAISAQLLRHEAVHYEQQSNDPDAWWGRYLIDPYFRIDQECEAYASEYAFYCKNHKDRNHRDKVLRQMAGFLSGELYGNVISSQAARKMIKAKSNVR